MIQIKELKGANEKFILFVREYYKKVQNILPIKREELDQYIKVVQHMRNENINGLLGYIYPNRKENFYTQDTFLSNLGIVKRCVDNEDTESEEYKNAVSNIWKLKDEFTRKAENLSRFVINAEANAVECEKILNGTGDYNLSLFSKLLHASGLEEENKLTEPDQLDVLTLEACRTCPVVENVKTEEDETFEKYKERYANLLKRVKELITRNYSLIEDKTPKTFFQQKSNNSTSQDTVDLKDRLTNIIRNLVFYKGQLDEIFDTKNGNSLTYEEIDMFLDSLEESLLSGEEVERKIIEASKELEPFSSKYIFLLNENGNPYFNTKDFNIEEFDYEDREKIKVLLDRVSVVDNNNIRFFRQILSSNTRHQMYAEFNSDMAISFVRLTDEIVLILTICKPSSDVFDISQKIIRGRDIEINNLKSELKESDAKILEQKDIITGIEENLKEVGAAKK